MQPKEIAIELVNRFYRIIPLDKMTIDFNLAKKCALIEVEEILKVACPDTFASKSYDGEFYSDQEYFEQVKKEIEKL